MTNDTHKPENKPAIPSASGYSYIRETDGCDEVNEIIFHATGGIIARIPFWDDVATAEADAQRLRTRRVPFWLELTQALAKSEVFPHRRGRRR